MNLLKAFLHTLLYYKYVHFFHKWIPWKSQMHFHFPGIELKDQIGEIECYYQIGIILEGECRL